jgi:hypothetical protein
MLKVITRSGGGGEGARGAARTAGARARRMRKVQGTTDREFV